MWKASVLIIGCILLVDVPLSKSANDQNPRYLPKEIELRPWTNTRKASGIVLEKHVPFHFMRLTLADFLNNCDGQCFYHAGDFNDSSKYTCDPGGTLKDCHLIASIARHGSAQCPFLGLALGRMNATICDESAPDKQLYSISLIRHVEHYSCEIRPFYYERHMPCIPTEFVAISFYPNGHPAALDDKDRWYVCIAGEPWISYWENVKTAPTQLKVSLPYSSSAPGVIDYRTNYDPISKTFACKFIISADDMNKDVLRLVDFPSTGSAGSSPVKIKLAQGQANRTDLPEDQIPKSLSLKPYNSLFRTAIEKAIELQYFKKQQAVERPIFDPPTTAQETLIGNIFIGHSPDTIDFPGIAVEMKAIHSISTESQHDADNKVFLTEIERCGGNPKGLKCFPPNQKKACVFRQSCSVLVIIEEVSHLGKKVLQFSLLSFSSYDDNDKVVVRPRGWAAVGLSKDYKMGDDLVVACLFEGEGKSDIVVSWNEGRVNIQKMPLNQGLIFDKEIKFIRNQASGKFLCKWKMNWKIIVDVQGYHDPPPPPAPGAPSIPPLPPVVFDLENEPGGTFLLTAIGKKVYPGGQISYHHQSEVIKETFIPDHVRQTNNANEIVVLTPFYIIIIFIIYNFIF